MFKLRTVSTWLSIGAAICTSVHCASADAIRLAVQKTGTVSWELDVMRAHELDRQAGITIKTVELATPEAGKIALRGGSVDVIAADWLWVSRERELGIKLVFFPYSSTLGAVMVPENSSVRTLGDLQNKTVAVAGGPIDKSWLLLRAAAKQKGVDLSSQANVVYGSPALLAGKMLQGEFDATLTYWNFSTRLETRGFRQVVSIDDLLPNFGIAGPLSMVGYVFSETWAATHPQTINRFLDACKEAKQILLTSDAEWERIAPLVGVHEASALRIYRDRYRQGIPRRSIDDEEKDARALYRVLRILGGPELVGPGTELAPGTYYRPDFTN
ncbi:MAG TPA: ABC transporter substrate-binding protein [Pseudolabrys sp.]|jgi:NitT/TauT family transport system substrate-binding protein|nr:ABC transporter substrate-binding protein [Pseudolabrys sp.]